MHMGGSFSQKHGSCLFDQALSLVTVFGDLNCNSSVFGCHEDRGLLNGSACHLLQTQRLRNNVNCAGAQITSSAAVFVFHRAQVSICILLDRVSDAEDL